VEAMVRLQRAFPKCRLGQRNEAQSLITAYLFPFAVVALALMVAFWQTGRRERERLLAQLDKSQALTRQLKKDRDAAMQELFRRFSEEGKLNRERSQFQAQLAEYEKYAALTQLALGAAHEIIIRCSEFCRIWNWNCERPRQTSGLKLSNASRVPSGSR